MNDRPLADELAQELVVNPRVVELLDQVAEAAANSARGLADLVAILRPEWDNQVRGIVTALITPRTIASIAEQAAAQALVDPKSRS